MKRPTTLATIVLLLALALLPGTVTTSGQESVPTPDNKLYRSENPIPNQYLAMLHDNIEGEEQSAAAKELAQQYDGQVLQCPYEPGVNGFSVQMIEANAQMLSQDARVEYVQEIPASGFPHSVSRTNIALASNGGQAFASSTLNSNFPVSAIINGDRRGAGWAAGTGGWNDATSNTFPDYLELQFNGEKRINEIDLFTLQDTFNNPAEPTPELTFTQYGVTAFRLSYWDSATGQWVMLSEVPGNNHVWRKIEFPTVLTTKLSVMILNGAANYSRVVEIEAWEAPPSNNVALSSNGGQAFASSTLSSGFPAAALINGDRSGTGWAAGAGGWHDATGDNFPDYLELHFNGEKRINEIDFVTLQDNFNEPVEPTAEMTFSQYGVTAFRVNYWDSTAAQWVPLTEIQNNSNVWRKIEFDPIQTSKLSIMILNGANSYSRVVEIEAWEAIGAAANPSPIGEGPPIFPEDEEKESTLPAVSATAAAPLHRLRRAPNLRYFQYNLQTITLFGTSASYLPHIARFRNQPASGTAADPLIFPVKENCTLDLVDNGIGKPKIPKYQKCLTLLKGAGLNHIQIWIALNHSVGKLRIERGSDPATGRDPYANEQPFTWNNTQKKWSLPLNSHPDPNPAQDLLGFDNTFFTNLKSVVQYCQEQDIIVGIVLFDPWSGEVDDQPKLSPWYADNNISHLSFSDRSYFVKAETPAANPQGAAGTAIDTTQANKDLRKLQVLVMQRTAKELQDLKNFYWILANEPDMDGRALGQNLVVWLKYMANELRAYEQDKLGGKTHLIGVTVTTNKPGNEVIDAIRTFGKIEIIASHYVHLKAKEAIAGPGYKALAVNDRFSALRLLKTYNAYQSNGVRNPENDEIWGFNEGRYTGTVEDTASGTDTAAAARVEAWEFFLNGGALFDHLSYRWGNSTAEDNANPKPGEARTYFKFLSKFLSTIPLDKMHRMTTNQTGGWLKEHPADNPTIPGNEQLSTSYWAAMSNGEQVQGSQAQCAASDVCSHFLYYLHRSTRSGANSDRYRVYTGGTLATAKTTVQKSGMGTGCFRAEWFYPDGQKVEGKPVNGAVNAQGVLQTVVSSDFYFTAASTTQILNGPKYNQDVVLKITKRPGVTQPNCH